MLPLRRNPSSFATMLGVSAYVITLAVFGRIASAGVVTGTPNVNVTGATKSATAAPATGFIREMRSIDGLQLGGGLSVHLDSVPSTNANASLFERHALRLDYKGTGLKLGYDGKEDAYKMGLYSGAEAGRQVGGGGGGGGKKGQISDLILPAMLGFKTTTLVVMAIFGVTVFVLKALIVAKMAAVAAATLIFKKYFSGHHHSSQPIELDYHPSQMHPVYAEYPGDLSDIGYAQTASGNYLAYSAAAPPQQHDDIAAASQQQYAFVEATPVNDTQRRRISLSKASHPLRTLITVRRKTVEH